MAEHKLHECNDEHCPACPGGLTLCDVCHGAEASLPTECSGRRMTATELDNVQAGNIDFRGGRFICLDQDA